MQRGAFARIAYRVSRIACYIAKVRDSSVNLVNMGKLDYQGYVFRWTVAQLVSVGLRVKRILRRNRKTINETRSVTANGYSFLGLLTLGLGRMALSPCCAAAYDMHTKMSSSPAGGLRLPTGKHAGILTYIQTMSTKKRPKRNFFWLTFFNIEIRTIYLIIFFKRAEFF